MSYLPEGWKVDHDSIAEETAFYKDGNEVTVHKRGLDMYASCLNLNDLDGLIQILQLIQRKQKGE